MPRRPRIEPWTLALEVAVALPNVSPAKSINGTTAVLLQTRAVDGTFYAEHQPRIILEIVADMGAANHALRALR